MSIVKRLIVSTITGLLISIAGLVLVAIGGYGPCGPASFLAGVGELLCLGHFEILCRVVPPVETLLQRVDQAAVNVVVMITVAAVNWAIATFVALSIWARIRGRR